MEYSENMKEINSPIELQKYIGKFVILDNTNIKLLTKIDICDTTKLKGNKIWGKFLMAFREARGGGFRLLNGSKRQTYGASYASARMPTEKEIKEIRKLLRECKFRKLLNKEKQ
jgi:hypothetical protein